MQLPAPGADEKNVLDLTLAQPTYEDLIGVLTNQCRLLERLLFRHAEVAMLIAAGEHRFVSRAIDEALEIESDLGAADLARAMTVAALDRGETVSEIAAHAPEDLQKRLLRLADDMARMLDEVNTYRRQAAAWAGERSRHLTKALGSVGSTSGYSADGSAA
jgi:hypothetical protein